MAVTQRADILNVLKTTWPQKRIFEIAYKNRPFLALCKKDSNFGGEARVLGVWYGGTGVNASGSFANSQTNATPGKYAKFSLTHVSRYVVVQVSGLAMAIARKSEDALINEAEDSMKSGINGFMDSLAILAYRNHGGARGQIGSFTSSATGTITLSNASDVRNFEVGMVLKFSTADGTSGSERAGTIVLTGVNRSTGVLSGDTTTVGIANSDYIFVQGDFGASIFGIDSWNPATVSGSDSFNGVNRSADEVRLAGLRVDASSAGTYTDAFAAVEEIALREMDPEDMTHLFLNPIDYSRYKQEQGSLVQYIKETASMKNSKGDIIAQVGFNGIEWAHGYGLTKVIPDPACPKGVGRLGNPENYELWSTDPIPNVLSEDSLEWARLTTDAYELRAGNYLQGAVRKPKGWCRITLPTST